MKRALAVVLVAVFAAAPAAARNGGLYFELAPGYGLYNTDDVIVENGDDGSGELAESSFSPGLKLGVNLFGWAGAEAQFAGHFWGVGQDPGGGGFAGGVFRVTPLEAFTYILADDFQLPALSVLGPTSWKDRPFDLGFSIGGGFTMVGEDYAYQGSYFQWGFDLKYFVTPNFALGIDLPFRHTNLQPFRYTDYGDGEGVCTDGKDGIGRSGFVHPVNPNRIFGDEFLAADIESECDGTAPSALFFAPAFTIAGVFDFGI
jgi:hypothetical protein